jgi:hypothetical protein
LVWKLNGDQQPTRSGAWRVRVLVAAGVIVAVGACSSEESTDDNPYAAEFAAGLERATSDFEREVLSDLEITRAEYEEAVSRYVECAAEQGLSVAPVPQGGYYTFSFRPTSDSDRIMDECRPGTIDVIEPIYVSTVRNPNNENLEDLQAACLVRKGLAPAGFTGEDYHEAMFGGPEPDFPFDTEDPRFRECLTNPSLD